MTIPVGEKFKNKFPHTSSVLGLLVAGMSCIAAGAPLLVVDNVPNPFNLVIIFAYVLLILGFVLAILPLLILIMELFSFFIPGLSSLSKKLIDLLLNFLQFIKGCYIKIIRFFIEGAVRSIISDRGRGQKLSFAFQKQEKDDHYFPDVLNFRKLDYSILIKHNDLPEYWRLGVKFSESGMFIPDRHGTNYPLFHLTKNQGENFIRATYYNSQNKMEYNEKIIDYLNKDIIIDLEFDKNAVSVDVVIDKTTLVKSQKIGEYRFGQLFAWGDRESFYINTEISTSSE